MRVKRINGFVIFEIIWLVVQAILILLMFAYAFLGTYTSNHASNIWSVIWDKGLALWQLLSGVVAFVSGVIGILSHKDNKVQLALSILLICTIPASFISLIFGVGSHY